MAQRLPIITNSCLVENTGLLVKPQNERDITHHKVSISMTMDLIGNIMAHLCRLQQRFPLLGWLQIPRYVSVFGCKNQLGSRHSFGRHGVTVLEDGVYGNLHVDVSDAAGVRSCKGSED